MEETITITKLDYDLLIGQNNELRQQNIDLQKQLLKETKCSQRVLTVYCTVIADIIKNQNELAEYFDNKGAAENG